MQTATDSGSFRRFRNILGPLAQYLEQDDVCNVDVNPNGSIAVQRFGKPYSRAPEEMPREHRRALIKRLAFDAEKTIDEINSRLSADMQFYDVRVQCFCPPAGDWSLQLRRHAARVFTLDDYLRAGIIDDRQHSAITRAVVRRESILVSGAVNAGKSTLLNALLAESASSIPDLRVVAIQDRRELKMSHWNSVELFADFDQASPRGDGSRYIFELPEMLKDALRTSYELLIWGELRDGLSAVGLMLALSGGAGGLMSTIHSESAHKTLARLEKLLLYGKSVVIRSDIAKAINCIVHMTIRGGVRKCSDVLRVRGVDENDQYIFEKVA